MLWTVGERHIWALGDAEVAPCPIFPSVKEVLIESLGVLTVVLDVKQVSNGYSPYENLQGCR